MSVFGSVELNLAGGEAGQAYPASSSRASLVSSLQPVRDPDQFVQSAGVRLDWKIVYFVSSGLFALQTKAGKRIQSYSLNSNIMCRNISREITIEMSANCCSFKHAPVKVCRRLWTNLHRENI